MRRIAAIIALVVIVAVGWLVFGGNSKDKQSSDQRTNHSGSQSQTPSNNPSKPVATDKVSIADMAFSPAAITVKAGSTVTWTNNDSVAHTVTENDGQDGPSSSPLSPGQSYSFTYKKAGTYKYICTIHTYMNGTVTVTQ